MSRGWLALLTPVYGGVVAAKNLGYARGWLRARRLAWPVISVGNLSVGGAGKTPLVIRLVELLEAAGFSVDVLSRGYGRRSSAVEVVDPGGDALRFGDEPLLIARRTGRPVVVGGSRYEAGLVAEARCGVTGLAGLHLLDDGFQHRGLARDLDVVVVHRSDFGGRLLPAGRLREPLRALRRADFVVLREEDAGLEAAVRGLGVTAPIWWMRRVLDIPDGLGRVMAFCGIARPEEFFAGLGAAGAEVAGRAAFGDHHAYSAGDLERVADEGRRLGVTGFVTTEKDAVRLSEGLRGVLERVAPLRVAGLRVELRDEAAVVGAILESLASKTK